MNRVLGFAAAWLLGGCLLAALPPTSHAAYAGTPSPPQAPVRIARNDVSVEVRSEGELLGRSIFTIRIEAGGKSRDVRMQNDTVEIERLEWGASDRLLVFGTNGYSQTVAIIDLVRAGVVDYFWCLQPVASPDGRYIVFKGQRSRVDPANYVICVYDVRLAPAANRVSGVGTDTSTLSEVGLPVFPETNVRERTVRAKNDFTPSKHFCPLEPFVWVGPDAVAFLYCIGDADRVPRSLWPRLPTGLAVVDLQRGVNEPASRTALLTTEGVFDSRRLEADAISCGEFVRAEIVPLASDDLHIRLRVVLPPRPALRVAQVDFEFPRK